MKKEYSLVIAIALFIIAYAIDRFAGPVSISIKSPLAFLSPVYLTKFPFTGVAITLRSLAIIMSVVLLLSFIENKFFIKAIVLLCLGALAELYAVQQLATGMRTTTIQWTLSFSYAGMAFILPFAYYILRGIIESLHSKLVQPEKPTPPVTQPEVNNKSGDFWKDNS